MWSTCESFPNIFFFVRSRKKRKIKKGDQLLHWKKKRGKKAEKKRKKGASASGTQFPHEKNEGKKKMEKRWGRELSSRFGKKEKKERELKKKKKSNNEEKIGNSVPGFLVFLL